MSFTIYSPITSNEFYNIFANNFTHEDCTLIVDRYRRYMVQWNPDREMRLKNGEIIRGMYEKKATT